MEYICVVVYGIILVRSLEPARFFRIAHIRSARGAELEGEGRARMRNHIIRKTVLRVRMRSDTVVLSPWRIGLSYTIDTNTINRK